MCTRIKLLFQVLVQVLHLTKEVVYDINMNKLVFVLLAVCLVAVHAHVKRDAPAAPANNENYLEKFKTTFDDLGKDINNKLKETFNPDEMKKSLDQFVDGVNKFIEDAKAKKPSS